MTPSAAWLDALPSGGEMGARIREADWASTPLGPPQTWPPALRTATGIMLTARFPMLIAWGPELIQLYNDAMIPVLGEQHPQTARPLTDTLAPLLDQVRPFVDAVLAGGEASWQPEQRVWLDRLGTPEDLYFMSSYSPILDDEGAVGGLLVTAFETTPRVLDARRLRAVSDLGAATVEAATADGAQLFEVQLHMQWGQAPAQRLDLQTLRLSRAGAVSQ